MSFAQLENLGRTLESVSHAQSILGADEAIAMPNGGGEKRAEALAYLSGHAHQLATAPHVGDWIAAAETESLSEDQAAALYEFKQNYISATCLPSDFVARQTETTIRCEQLWRTARAENNWALFQPALTNVVALAREEAAMRSATLGLSPYDALMEKFDPGNRAADITPIFNDLKSFLVGFVPEVIEAQASRQGNHRFAQGQNFPINAQRDLGLTMMNALGFDFNHGRLDVSHHPFCGGVPTDVRMTTRYDATSFLSALLGVLHETGHALYEQGLPKAWSHTPLGQARGMSMHESQSLFIEMQLAHKPEFWQWALPIVREHLGADVFAGWEIPDVVNYVNDVQKSFIRVDADEVTYPLHIILRFELEQALISGALEVADLPEAWDAKMQQYLGLSTLDNPADGPMQDVHWPAGAFGYFPSYTLGAMMAAQQWNALQKQIPDADTHVARGDFAAINAWRAQNIWSQGSKFSTPELLKRATGETLNPEYFIAHLKARYL